MKKLFLFSLIATFTLLWSCSEDEDPAPPTAPTGTITESVSGKPGDIITIAGTFSDDQGISNVTFTSSDLDIGDSESGDGVNVLEFSTDYVIPATTAPGNYTIAVVVTNVANLVANFEVAVEVLDPGCTNTFAVFDGETWNAESAYESPDFPAYEESFTDITTTLDGSTVTIDGDFLDWGTIDDTYAVSLTGTFTADEMDQTKGTFSFEVEDFGEQGDGYIYRLVPGTTTSTYDACEGTMTIYTDCEYADGAGGWVYYFTTSSVFTLAD